jgi:hypothetical protein
MSHDERHLSGIAELEPAVEVDASAEAGVQIGCALVETEATLADSERAFWLWIKIMAGF